MRELAAISDLGRPGRLVRGPAFAVDTADPGAGALMARAEERGTAISNELHLRRARVGRRSPTSTPTRCSPTTALAFCRHYLASARRYRPHLLSEPEERILSDKSRHREQRVGAAVLRAHVRDHRRIPIDGDGTAVSLEQGLSQLMSPDRDVRRDRGRGGHRRARARAAHARVRVQHAARRQVDRRPAAQLPDAGSRAATSPTRRATSRCRRWSTRCRRATTSRSAGTRSRRSCSASTASPTTTAWRRWRAPTRSSAGTRRDELVLDAYASFSPELADVGRALLRRVVDRRADAAGQAARRVLRVHGAVHHPYLLLNWTARRRDVLTLAHELGPRPARVPGARAGHLPPDHAADAGRDRVGVRRDGHVRPAARRHRRSRRAARAAGREPRGPDRHRVPPDRDEPVRGPRAHAAPRARASCRSSSSTSCGPTRRPRCSATRSRSPRATARGGRTSRTSWARPGTCTRTPTGSCSRCRCTARYEERGDDVRAAATSSCSRAGGSTLARGARSRSSAATSPTPAFWDGGLDIVAEQLDAAEAAAKATGRL